MTIVESQSRDVALQHRRIRLQPHGPVEGITNALRQRVAAGDDVLAPPGWLLCERQPRLDRNADPRRGKVAFANLL
jgi:hypothetical protein